MRTAPASAYTRRCCCRCTRHALHTRSICSTKVKASRDCAHPVQTPHLPRRDKRHHCLQPDPLPLPPLHRHRSCSHRPHAEMPCQKHRRTPPLAPGHCSRAHAHYNCQRVPATKDGDGLQGREGLMRARCISSGEERRWGWGGRGRGGMEWHRLRSFGALERRLEIQRRGGNRDGGWSRPIGAG